NNASAGTYQLGTKVVYDTGATVSSAPVYYTLNNPPTRVDTSGLVTYLPFDDSLAAKSGTVNASVLNGTAKYTNGKFGDAVSFANNGSSGTTPSDWAATLGNLDSIYAGDFTISLWARTASMADAAVFGNKNWASGGNPGFVVASTVGKTINWN